MIVNADITLIIYLFIELAAIIYLLLISSKQEKRIHKMTEIIKMQFNAIHQLEKKTKHIEIKTGYDHTVGGESK